MGISGRRGRLPLQGMMWNFSGTPGISQAKVPGYPAKKFGLTGFRGTSRIFGPHPFTWKTPHPTGRYPDPKMFGFAFPFQFGQSLILGRLKDLIRLSTGFKRTESIIFCLRSPSLVDWPAWKENKRCCGCCCCCLENLSCDIVKSDGWIWTVMQRMSFFPVGPKAGGLLQISHWGCMSDESHLHECKSHGED